MKKIVAGGAMAALLAIGLFVGGGSTSSAQEPTTASADGDGVLAGNAVRVDIDVPITICGVISKLLGLGNGGCIVTGIHTPDNGQASASGDGVASGNVINLDLDLPITLAESPVPPPNPCCPPPTVCCVPPTTICCIPTTTVCCVTTTTSTTTTSTTSTTVTSTTVPSTTVPSTTTPSTTAPPGSEVPPPPQAARLAVTGTATAPLVLAGFGSLVAGVLLVGAARRRTRFRPLP